MNMRYMICFAVRENMPKIETEYYESFSDAVMRYTVLCSNCRDVVLSDLEKSEIIRHFSCRKLSGGVSVTAY